MSVKNTHKNPLLKLTTTQTSDMAVPKQRRQFMQGLGISALTLATADASIAASETRTLARRNLRATRVMPAQLDNSVVVSRTRLDELTALQHAVFNEGNVLRSFDASTQGAKFDVALHRITTHTRLAETDETVKVSGLLALPVNVKTPLPVVSWQHGTILSFDQVPSNLTRIADPAYVMHENADSAETLFNIHRLAGNGYAVIAADYLGKGPYRKNRPEAYAVKDTSVQTCLDVLDAGLSCLHQLGHRTSSLYLNGWSQGSLNTQWLHQELRRRGRAIAATALQSPFNDLNEALRFWSGAETYPSTSTTPYPSMPTWVSLCMIITLGSYEHRYGLHGLLRSAIRPQFHDLALKFWNDYQMDFDMSKPFPSGSTLLVDGFFDTYTHDLNSKFLRQLAENRATYWSYDAPTRFYYGLADEAIHPNLVKRPLSAGGKFVTGVPVKGASHRATFLASLYGEGAEIDGSQNVLTWFNTKN